MPRRSSVALAVVAGLGLLVGAALGPGLAGAQEEPSATVDPAGTWEVEGWNPGADPGAPPSYEGRVTVRSTGDATFDVLWTIQGSETRGFAIYHEESGTLSISYLLEADADEPTLGTGLYFLEEDRADGAWSTGSSRGRLGHEDWTR